MKTAVFQNHEIPAIHHNLLTEMKFFEKPNLTSIGLLEEGISKLQHSIENNVRLAIIPLKAFCIKFFAYLPLFNTNVQTYVQ